MEFIKKLKTRSILKSIGWMIFLGLFGLLFTILCLEEFNPVMLVMGLGFLAGAAYFLIAPLTGKYQKQILAKARELAGERYEVVLNCAQQLYQEQKAFRGLRIGYGLVFWESGASQMLFDVRDICWVYQQTTTTRLYGIIPVGKSYSVILKTKDRKMISIPMTKKTVADKIRELLKELPNALGGYSKELEALYNKDAAQFAQSAAAARAKQRAQQ